VDARGGKLLEFLKENNHLDLEVPDIAFSVKKSEKTVEAALQKLQQKGLVTARQNEYGRVYWYALPSAPITRSFKLDELKPIKESVKKNRNEVDDEIDLSELQSASSLQNSNKMQNNASDAIVTSGDTIKMSTDLSKYDSLPKSSQNESIDLKTDTVINGGTSTINKSVLPVNHKSDTEENTDFEPSRQRFNYSLLTLPAIIIVGLISLSALIRSCNLATKMKMVESAIPKDVVSVSELNNLKSEMHKIDEMEKRIATFSGEIDSVKALLEEMKLQAIKSSLQYKRIASSLKQAPAQQKQTRKRR
jgi:predicted transcriptional regulator